MNGTENSHIYFDLHVKRVNRSSYAINGNITYREPFTKDPSRYYVREFQSICFGFFCSNVQILCFMFQHSVNFYISPLGNNQFEKMPIRFQKISYCDYMNTNYRKYFMASARSPATDLPYSDDPNADLCAAFRADHEVSFRFFVPKLVRICRLLFYFFLQLVIHFNNYSFDKSVLPKNVPEGLFRIEFVFELDAVVVAGITVILRTELDPNEE